MAMGSGEQLTPAGLAGGKTVLSGRGAPPAQTLGHVGVCGQVGQTSELSRADSEEARSASSRAALFRVSDSWTSSSSTCSELETQLSEVSAGTVIVVLRCRV